VTQAGEFREVIDIQLPVETQDTAGQMDTAYENLYTGVRAGIVALSGREYQAAMQINAEITTRIKIRYRRGIVSNCRILHTIEDDSPPTIEVYDVLAVLPDPVSGRRYLNLMCARRFSDGWRHGE